MPLLLSRVLSKTLFDIDREMHSHSRLGKARETFLLKKHFISGNPVTLEIQRPFVSPFCEIDCNIQQIELHSSAHYLFLFPLLSSHTRARGPQQRAGLSFVT